MTLHAYKKGLKPIAASRERTIWQYQSTAHILDIMVKPGYFDKHGSRLMPGDIILVECPGFYAIERMLGYPPQAVHRAGGGVLQVEPYEAGSGKIRTKIVGRGLRHLVRRREDGLSTAFMPAPRNKGAGYV